jgi:hypothetical protein
VTPVKIEVHVVERFIVTVVVVFMSLKVVDVVVATNSVIVDVSVFNVSLEALYPKYRIEPDKISRIAIVA